MTNSLLAIAHRLAKYGLIAFGLGSIHCNSILFRLLVCSCGSSSSSSVGGRLASLEDNPMHAHDDYRLRARTFPRDYKWCRAVAIKVSLGRRERKMQTTFIYRWWQKICARTSLAHLAD